MDAICFGFNYFGQLSKEKFTSLQTLLAIAPDRGIKYVSFSWSKSHIILDDGALVTKGFVDKQMFQTKSLMLPFNTEVKKFTSLGEYELCLTADGKCWKYVSNRWENITKYWNVIDRESAKKELKIIDICSSDTLHLALSDTGLIFNIPIQIETPPKIKIMKISCGSEHCLGLTENGSVYTWGNGSRGQLGNGSLHMVEVPELLTALDGLAVIDIAAGGWHSAAVTDSGDIYTWGWNNYGQLGLRTSKDLLRRTTDTYTVLALPKYVDYPNSENIHVKQVSCGNQHTMILLENGAVYGCGWNKYGQVDPHSDFEYADQMIAIRVPQHVDKIHRIFCESWNSVIFVTYKNRPQYKYEQSRKNDSIYEAESTTKSEQKYNAEDAPYETRQPHPKPPEHRSEDDINCESEPFIFERFFHD